MYRSNSRGVECMLFLTLILSLLSLLNFGPVLSTNFSKAALLLQRTACKHTANVKNQKTPTRRHDKASCCRTLRLSRTVTLHLKVCWPLLLPFASPGSFNYAKTYWDAHKVWGIAFKLALNKVTNVSCRVNQLVSNCILLHSRPALIVLAERLYSRHSL